MVRKKICIDCGNEFTLKDDSKKNFKVCAFCFMKKVLYPIKEEEEKLRNAKETLK